MSISSLFDGFNAGYVQDLFEEYSRNPRAVPEAWRDIFSTQLDELVAEGLLVPDALQTNGLPVRSDRASDAPTPAVEPRAESRGDDAPLSAPGEEVGSAATTDDRVRLLPLIARAAALIQAFRDHGHQLATIDPLGTEPPGHPQLDPSFFGTSMEELGEVPTSLVMDGAGDEPLSETLARLQSIYCGSVGYQFEHLEDPERVQWLWETVESGTHSQELGAEDKVSLLRRLSEVEGLETFLHRTYLGQKRFSIEGTDMMVPMLDEALRLSHSRGGRSLVLGMAHRGRLNVLCHILGVGYQALLREFEGAPQDNVALSAPGTGDVKYHHGATGSYELPDGDTMEVTLAPNPSHLEFVNPVVQGMARALQFDGTDAESNQDWDAVVPVLIHGDAAFAAEGVVAESLNLARLRGYTVGGVIHIIANNQVGFTTNPSDGRSTRYASDVAKGYDIPVVHVNADDPQACLSAVRLAMAYRAEFGDDMVIDLVGYRRHGHNEGDEPSYTQPALYEKIREHPTVKTLFARQLMEEGIIGEDDADGEDDRITKVLRDAQDTVKEEKEASTEDPFPPPPPKPEPIRVDTPVSMDVLEEVNRKALEIPDGFTIHPKLGRQLMKRVEDFDHDTPLDWAHAESLAFGSLILEGIPVRMSGQDAERGTFSQRHLVLHDHETGSSITPLARMGGGRFEIFNSPLSETGVMGFEYGHSVADEVGLGIWEAQFGDFVNVAQPILDQFLASGYTKWGQLASLTLLLPHGYEGQGPEHSSARLERFLQMCAEDNMRVAYPTTPAQYFHLLRRQALVTPPRPLIVMTPKSLLRHPRAQSTPAELAEGGFRPVLFDPMAEGHEGEVTRLLLCSGKVYYDISGADDRKEMPHVAVARVEELYPFPSDEVKELLERYPGVEEVVWVQEEPRNMGALTYIGPLLRNAVPREIRLRHVSRPERASPSEGQARAHAAKQGKVVAQALGTWED